MDLPRRFRVVWLGIAAIAIVGAGCDGAGSSRKNAERALRDGRYQDAYAIAVELTEADAEASAKGTGVADVEPWLLLAQTAYLTMRTSPGVEAARRAVEDRFGPVSSVRSTACVWAACPTTRPSTRSLRRSRDPRLLCPRLTVSGRTTRSRSSSATTVRVSVRD